jgi:hypothetical protein
MKNTHRLLTVVLATLLTALGMSACSRPSSAPASSPPAQSRSATRTRSSGDPLTAKDKQAINEKLSKIIIKKIEFVNCPLKDAVTQLIELSRQEDLPSHQGVNILMELPHGASPAPGAPATETPPTSMATIPVNLNLVNAPLGQAIKFLTMITGLKYRIERDAVMIVSGEIVTGTQTRIFNVNPGVFHSAGFLDQGGVGAKNRTDIRKVLEEFGITLPSGSWMSYQDSLGLLVVTHRPEVLDQIEEILLRMNKTPPQVQVEMRLVEIPSVELENALQCPSDRTGRLMDTTLAQRIAQLEKDRKAVLQNVLRFTTTSGEQARQLLTTEYSYIAGYQAGEKTPPTPIREIREVGLILDVRPQVGPDNFTISITLSPEQVALKQPVRKAEVHVPGCDRPVTIDLPEFEKWSTSTSLIVWDGATILLGAFDPLDDGKARAAGRKMLALLTLRLVAPSGKPLRNHQTNVDVDSPEDILLQ